MRDLMKKDSLEEINSGRCVSEIPEAV